MQILLILALFFVASQAVPQGLTINNDLNADWEAYKTRFGRKYESLTDISRRLIWEENLRYIQQHNLEHDLGKHTYTLGLNEYADMTNEEFKAKYFGKKQTKKSSNNPIFLEPENIGDLPTTVDWRQKGYVTPIKNQVCYNINLFLINFLSILGSMWIVLVILHNWIVGGSTFPQNRKPH